MSIPVYQAEQDLGIGDLVAKGCITFASAIKPSELKVPAKEFLEKYIAIASANPNQLDLYYKNSVLASIGWNKNDDVFTKLYTWNARNTVADKQLNLGHDEMNIVGHMTNSCVYDAQGNIIPDDTNEDKIPDQFDVITEFVIYKIWANEDRREEIGKIITDIENGNGYVSMECRFPAFDYAVIDSEGNHKVVARNENTAFLSQHLKAFGGTGEYQGYKVGRLLKDFFFTGQGIVSNPANERSVIFDANNKPFSSKGSITIRDNQMDLEAQVKDLAAKLATANSQLQQFADDKAKADKEAAEAASKAFTAAKAEVETIKTQAGKLGEEVKAKDTTIASLTEELKTAAEKVKVAKAEVDSMKETAKKTARAAKLANRIDADKVEATLTKWASLSDEQFDEIAAMYPPKDAKEPDADDKAKKEKAKADLAKAELEKNAGLNTGGDGTGEKSRATVLGEFLVASLPYSANASARVAKENK